MRLGEFRVWSVGMTDDTEIVFIDRHAYRTDATSDDPDEYGGCTTGTFTNSELSNFRYTNDTIVIDAPMPLD